MSPSLLSFGGSGSGASARASASPPEGISDRQQAGGQQVSARPDVPLPRAPPATTRVRWLAWKRVTSGFNVS